jgi:hypothetical protein
LLFAIEGRVGQRKLWGIVGLARRYPAHCVDAACAQALEQGIYSYKRVLALTEAIFAQATGSHRDRVQRCAGKCRRGPHADPAA